MSALYTDRQTHRQTDRHIERQTDRYVSSVHNLNNNNTVEILAYFVQ